MLVWLGIHSYCTQVQYFAAQRMISTPDDHRMQPPARCDERVKNCVICISAPVVCQPRTSGRRHETQSTKHRTRKTEHETHEGRSRQPAYLPYSRGRLPFFLTAGGLLFSYETQCAASVQKDPAQFHFNNLA
eukprot:SAG25_NODE_279_length_10479_cov_3.241233_7_plen_132_part_00